MLPLHDINRVKAEAGGQRCAADIMVALLSVIFYPVFLGSGEMLMYSLDPGFTYGDQSGWRREVDGA